ncbi:apolipoprotein D-like [Ruditapes philippinarum]|uniref:apolipoprotein D-like n=1 Tax=Ruditapes philippinarum TaxID=129788 RepID=UPI00295B2B5C|nr:apolipoprotein D-like [Ruditapes philippinarum]
MLGFSARFVLLITLVGVCACQVFQSGECPKAQVQQNFDIKKYVGKWYEQRRFAFAFEAFQDCVTAEYTLRDDGLITVNNTGYNTLTRSYSTNMGDAASMDPNNPAKLGVKFFSGQPRGDYWVLSTDYTSYTVIWSCGTTSVGPLGHFNTELSWILTRTPEGIPESKMNQLLELMKGYGINTSKFSVTNQRSCPGRS